MHGVSEAGDALARGVELARDLFGRPPRGECAGQQPGALLRRAEEERSRPEDPGRDGALQRLRVGRERHPGGDVRRHQPVLGDRDQHQVEELALLVGRLAARQQEVEVLGEADAAHQVAREVASRAPRPGRDRPG